jgi:hypothetical protein
MAQRLNGKATSLNRPLILCALFVSFVYFVVNGFRISGPHVRTKFLFTFVL